MTTPEEALAGFVATLTVDAVPAATLARVRQHVLDAIACGLAGATAEGRPQMASVAVATFGPGPATVLAGDPLAPAGAALLNGFQIAAPTLGDVHRETLTHVMPEVLPAALATAETRGADGSAFLAGIAAGLEATVRVARALDVPAYRERGFHNPGIAGAVGAACAAARIAGLDPRGVAVAIGHAASQAGGTFAALGTSGVKVHQARGALSGLLAAELAAAGIDASERSLTAARGGLLPAYADGGEPDRLVDGLGSRWELEAIALRRWPGASSVQPVIEAALGVRDELGLAAGVPGLASLAEAGVDLPPRAYALNGALGWDSRLAALQSARWAAAVVLEDGEAWLDQTSDERRADPAVAAFAARVEVREDAALPATAARVSVRTTTGAVVAREVAVPVGDPGRRLTDDDVAAKLRRAAAAAGLGAAGSGTARVAAEIAAAVGALEHAPNLRDLTRLLRREASPGTNEEAR